MLSRPSTNAMGTVARSTARPRSATMRIRRRGSRSTQTPANRLNSAVGAAATAASTPISTGPACSVITAVSGRARSVIWSPKSEMVWPTQNFRNSPSRHRLVTPRSVGRRHDRKGTGPEIAVALCGSRADTRDQGVPPRSRRCADCSEGAVASAKTLLRTSFAPLERMTAFPMKVSAQTASLLSRNALFGGAFPRVFSVSSDFKRCGSLSGRRGSSTRK